jgi:hypothetical protein
VLASPLRELPTLRAIERHGGVQGYVGSAAVTLDDLWEFKGLSDACPGERAPGKVRGRSSVDAGEWITAANTLYLPTMAEGDDRDRDGPSRRRASEERRAGVYRWALRYAGGSRSLRRTSPTTSSSSLWEHLPRSKDQDDLAPWLFRVTANVAISKIRRESRAGQAQGVFQLAGDERDEDAAPDDQNLPEGRRRRPRSRS